MSAARAPPPAIAFPDLPTTDHEFVLACRREADAAAGTADGPARTFQFAWALVHSTWATDVRSGRDLARTLASDPAAEPAAVREARYLEAVGTAKGGDLVAARRILAALLAEVPGWRQAETLKKDVDDAIVREGLTGLGIVAGAVVTAGALIAAFTSRR